MTKNPLLIAASEIAANPGERKTHFLNPRADRLRLSLGDRVGLKNIGVHRVIIEPGRESTEYHQHYQEEECLYVLEGKATLRLDGEEYPLGAGDFVGFPVNGGLGSAPHAIINNSDAPFVMLVMGQRLDFDVTDYPDQGKRLYRHDKQWDLVDIDSLEHPDTRGPKP